MKQAEFDALRKQAKELHSAQTGNPRVSLDAIFTALALATLAEDAPKVRKATEEAPPAWFTETLAKMKGSGERATVSRFLMLAGRFPATRSDSLAVGRWLREAGYTPRKTGGNILFEFE